MTGKQRFFVLFFAMGALIQSTRAYASPVYFAPPECYFGCPITMTDHGGPVMTGVTDVYTIFYGAPPTYYQSLEEFFYTLNSSDYMNLASLYGASTQIVWKGGYIENEYLGNSLSDADLGTIVTDFTNADLGAIVTPTPFSPAASTISPEANAIYYIFTGPDVTEQEDASACSFHSDVEGLKFVWVGIGQYEERIGDCGQGPTFFQDTTSNVSHELFETLTDPFVSEYYLPGETAWYDFGLSDGEIADPCNQESFPLSAFGFPGFFYTVQSIFVNDPSYAAGGYCASGNTYDGAAAVPEPATLPLFGAVLAGAAAMRRRKAKRAVRPSAICQRRVPFRYAWGPAAAP